MVSRLESLKRQMAGHPGLPHCVPGASQGSGQGRVTHTTPSLVHQDAQAIC